jgi:hypothetical protein
MKYPAGPELLEVQAQAEQAVIVSLKVKTKSAQVVYAINPSSLP